MTIFYILFAILFIAFMFILPKSKGDFGEVHVKIRLKQLPSSEYTVFNNLLIQRGNYSSQIDHVVVSRYGIFVIETKNYKGWIYGGENSEYWTQNIWGRKYKLYNPILQNQGHIKALQSYLGEGKLPFISIVAFSSRATIKSHFKWHNVCYIHNLPRLIKRHKNVILSDVEVQMVIKMLNKLPKSTCKESRRHKEYIYTQKNKRQQAIFLGKCPKCGGTLIQRTGKYGSFYGCSNYPRCKFTCQ